MTVNFKKMPPKLHPPVLLTDEAAVAYVVSRSVRQSLKKSPPASRFCFYQDTFRPVARAFFLSWMGLSDKGWPIIKKEIKSIANCSLDLSALEQSPIKALEEIQRRLGYLPSQLCADVCAAAGIEPGLKTVETIGPALFQEYHNFLKSLPEPEDEDEDEENAPYYRQSFQFGAPEQQFRLYIQKIHSVFSDFEAGPYYGALLRQHRVRLLADIAKQKSAYFYADQCKQILAHLMKDSSMHYIQEFIKYQHEIDTFRMDTSVIWKQGSLTLLEILHSEKGKGRTTGRFRCECGAEIVEVLGDLKPRSNRPFIFSCGKCGRHRTYNLQRQWKLLKDRHYSQGRAGADGWFSDVRELMHFLGLPSRPGESIHRVLGHSLPYSRANASWRDHKDNSADHRPPELYEGVNGDQWTLSELAHRLGITTNALAKQRKRAPQTFLARIAPLRARPKHTSIEDI